MTALYTFDVFSTLDGYGSFGPEGDWGGYWGKQGPEFLDRRLALYREPQRLVLGANTMRMFMHFVGPRTGLTKDVDPVNSAMRSLPTTVVSSTLDEPLDWPDATLVRGDAVDLGTRLKAESDVPRRSHGSLSLNRALMAAGLVDRVQVTIFPVVSGRTGTRPIFEAAADFDLELLESRTLDGRTQELIYRPTTRLISFIMRKDRRQEHRGGIRRMPHGSSRGSRAKFAFRHGHGRLRVESVPAGAHEPGRWPDAPKGATP